MKRPDSFLLPDEQDLFQTPGRRITRTIVPSALESIEPSPAATIIGNSVRELIDGASKFNSGPFFRLFAIQVALHDGMSWAAEEFQRDFSKQYPGFSKWLLKKGWGSNQLPVIADFVGMDRFLALAVKHSLVQPFLDFRSPSVLGLIAAALVSSAIPKCLELLLKLAPSKTGAGINLANPLPWLLGVLTATCVLIAGFVSKKSRLTRFRSSAIEELRNKLNVESAEDDKTSGVFEPPELTQFISAVAKALYGREYPRIVAVDEHEKLDRTTIAVLGRYLSSLAQQHRPIGSEIWVFYTHTTSVLGGTFDRRTEVLHPGSPVVKVPIRYKQQYLKPTEKQWLVDAAGLPAQAADLQVVKHICRVETEAHQYFRTLFDDHRKKHPRIEQQYTALDFLYVCSLSCAEDGFYFLTRGLQHDLAAKKEVPGKGKPSRRARAAKKDQPLPELPATSVRAKVLESVLLGTTLRQDEMRRRLDEIVTEFGSATLFTDEKKEAFRIATPAREVLEEVEADLRLPKCGLIHVFWALFWRDKLERHPVEPFWIHKLTDHLERAKAYELPPPLHKEAVPKLLDGYIYALRGSIRTGLFESLPELLKAPELRIGDSGDSDRVQLLEESYWNAYLLFGTAKALSAIAETASGTQIASRNRPDILFQLYGATLASDSNSPSALLYSLRNHALSASDCGRAIAAWILASLYCFENQLVSEVAQHPEEWLSAADAVIKRCISPFESGKDSEDCALHLLSLCLILWSKSLLLVRPFGLNQPGGKLERFSNLLHFASQCLKAVHVVKESYVAAPAVSQFDYISQELASDLALCVVAAVSTTAFHLGSETEELKAAEARVIDLANSAVQQSNSSLDSVASLASLTSDKYFAAIEKAFATSVAVWQALGHNRLHAIAMLRRVQLSTVRRSSQQSSYESVRIIAEALIPVVTSQTDLALLGQMTLKRLFAGMSDLASYHARAAAACALERIPREAVTQDLCWAAIEASHGLPLNLSNFIRPLLAQDAGISVLSRLFDNATPNQVNELALRLLNVAHRCLDTQAADALVEEVALHLNPNDDNLEQLQAQIDIFFLRNAVAKGTVKVDDVVRSWTSRRHSWTYAYLLSLFIAQDYKTDLLKQESLTIWDHDPPDSESDVWLILAESLLSRWKTELPTDTRTRMVHYVANAIGHWESRKPVEFNLSVYKLLNALDHLHAADHRIKIIQWQQVKEERDFRNLLPVLASYGGHFLLFQNQFESMHFFGLSTEVPEREFWYRYRTQPEAKMENIVKWRNSEHLPPPPFVKINNGRRLSADFLCLGHYLFTPPASQDQSFEADRRAFDEVAKRNIVGLVQIISDLPGLPGQLSALFKRHHEALQAFTQPADLPN